MGCAFEEGLKGGLLGFDIKWRSATIYGDGMAKFYCSTLRAIGEQVEILLMNEEKTKDKYIYVAEFVTCQKAILGSLQRNGGVGWSVGRAELEECEREGQSRMEKGFWDGVMLLLERSLLFVGDEDERLPGESNSREYLDEAVGEVLGRLESNGEQDCGCG